jgi:hypothetical protein
MSRIIDFDDGFTSETPSTIVPTLAEDVSFVPAGNLSSTDVQAALEELDSTISALPDPITYKGTWNGTTNTPTLSNSDTGKTGWLYQVSVSGSVDFGAGSISFEAGDKVVNNGTTWDKWDMTDAVSSVNGYTGAVTLVKGDISLGNVDNTSDATKNSASATLTNKTINGPDNTITNISLTTSVTGTLPIGNGGTGQTTANAALNALLPSQTSNAGKVLQTDGTNTSWGTAASGSLNLVNPSLQIFTSGSGNYNLMKYFVISSGNATAGDTYTNNSVTFTVHKTVSSSLFVYMHGNGDPAASGTLTRTSGSGDATLTFSTYQKPIYIKVKMVGGGGGGAGSAAAASNNGGNGGDGTATTFGTTLLSAGPGIKGLKGGEAGGAGGTASLGTGPVGVAIAGTPGGPGQYLGVASAYPMGGNGGSTPFGGGGSGGGGGAGAARAGATNTGSGGGGGAIASNAVSGSGGGGGAYVDARINTPSSTYAYVVGTGGSAGSAGTGGAVGGAGAAGIILVEEFYQ